MRKLPVLLSTAAIALLPVAVMSPAQAASFSVSASISTSSAQSGDGPYIKGTISPRRSRVINLQRYYSGAWHTIETTTSNSDGTYGKRLTPDDLDYAIGSLKFRAVVGSPDSGKSSTVTKTIYGWQELAELTSTSDNSSRYYDGGNGNGFGLVVNGKVAGDDAWVSKDPFGGEGVGKTVWNLNEKCIKLRGFAGIDDVESTTGAVGILKILIDGSGDYARTFDKFERATLNMSLNKTSKLTIASNRLNLDENTVVGVGEPEVLCRVYLPSDS